MLLLLLLLACRWTEERLVGGHCVFAFQGSFASPPAVAATAAAAAACLLLLSLRAVSTLPLPLLLLTLVS